MQAFDFLIINIALEVIVSHSGDFCPKEQKGKLCFLSWSKVRVCGRRGVGVQCCVWADAMAFQLDGSGRVSGFLGKLHVSGN